MKESPRTTLSLIEGHRRTLAGVVLTLLLAGALVAVRHPNPNSSTRVAILGGDRGSVAEGAPGAQGGPATIDPTTGLPSVAGSTSLPGGGPAIKRTPGKYIPGVGTIPLGISDTKIKVVYYWKGDQAMGSSAYLHGSGQEGNVDEGEAFRRLVQYVNKHANGGATFMGSTFNLHGRTIEPIVLESGKDASISAMTEEIVKKYKPFAAVSSHGSLSAYTCPSLADAGIFNFGTYDLGGKGGTLAQRSHGYCVPQATSWETQVEHVTNYLKQRMSKTKYVDASGSHERVYGFVYAAYPGLVDIAPKVIERLKNAGVNIADHAVLDAGLTTAATQAPTFVNRFRYNGVNTIISPDAGAPLSFTHAAEANAFYPDWFVWPCSGQDSTGMVRLYDAHQWERASGLTCYDPEFNADLVNNDVARQAEWYRQYQEVAPGSEPPAPTALVYQSLLPLLIGLTNAGRDVTVEKFVAGMQAFTPYRYSARRGKTTNGSFMLVTVGRQDLVGDVAEFRWSASNADDGGLQGQYVYTESRRYQRGATY